MPVSHQVGEDELRLELHTIVTSETFGRSQQLSRLLTFLCESLIAHRTDHMTEYAIGTEALGRPTDFDPTQDAAVRVEMHRLRRRLRDYYKNEGASHSVHIVIPPGGYTPAVARVGVEPNSEPVAEVPDTACTEPAEPSPAAPPPPARFAARHLRMLGLAAVAATLIGAWLLSRPPRAAATSGRADVAKGSVVLPLLSNQASVRIGCGSRSAWADRLGQFWGRDAYFEGGQPIEIPPRRYIPGAFDARLYQSARTGNFKYSIPLPAGTYELRLYFIEPVFGPDNDQGGEANRLFTIAINGQQIFNRFDILTDADGPWTADVRVFKDVSPDSTGHVNLAFQSIANVALVNAIEFVPARPHVLNPIRLLPQDNFYTDSAGNLWTPDNYSAGGRISTHPGVVANTRDQELFRHERFGRFRYAIPVDRGSYSAYFYLAEEYWGSATPAGGGEGTRVFSIFCNGTALLRSIDLLKEAGNNIGVVRAFHHLKPNAQGKLLLSFEPEHDYASLYALEVLDEAGPDRPSYERTLTGGGAN